MSLFAPMKRLLIVYHSRTGFAKQMATHLALGAESASKEMETPLNITTRRAAEATVSDLLAADGYLFAAPENLASVSGEMLEFFHRSYYDVFDDSERSLLLGRPVGIAVAGGSDGRMAARQMERIATGWRLKSVREPLVLRNGLVQTKRNVLLPKVMDEKQERECWELGGLVAATLLLEG